MRGYAAFLLLLFTTTSGASDLNQRVQGYYSCMKTGEFDRCFRTYVHWPTMFNMLSPEEKKIIGVTSPSEYKEELISVWIVDESAIRARLLRKELRMLSGYFKSKEYLSLTPQQQARERDHMEKYQENLDKVFQKPASQMREFIVSEKARFANSQYEILSINVTGNSAFVESEITDPSGNKRSERVRFQQIDGEWWIMD